MITTGLAQVVRDDNLPPLPEPQAKVWEYDQYGHGRFEDTDFFTEDQMRAYAAAAVAAERAACADICDQHASIEGIAQQCAAAIRARGQV